MNDNLEQPIFTPENQTPIPLSPSQPSRFSGLKNLAPRTKIILISVASALVLALAIFLIVTIINSKKSATL